MIQSLLQKTDSNFEIKSETNLLSCLRILNQE